MGRYPCCKVNNDLKKGPWTSEEDEKLMENIQEHGHGNWQLVPKRAGLNRCGKSCRLRWTNYLRPDVKRGAFSIEEEETIINLHSVLGNKWSRIAAHLPGRTDNEIKNLWNTRLKKKLLKSGIDPNWDKDFHGATAPILAESSRIVIHDRERWDTPAPSMVQCTSDERKLQ
ncbi:hypothetical protein RND71_012557 [Anisodus tanguticus]|uniref:Uncharacterized protein n=1 Tax=Anisodus tanguticus TaxID=243964 RepID=A0AAE1SFE5_9SOLA|nr:hypothetical protein RND71_012557 [Anisodus tanguticus]